jgi:hypothetical protein
VIEGIRFATPTDPAILSALQPLNTLEEVTSLLAQRGVKFQPASGDLDSLTLDPRLLDQMLKLKPAEVFVFPQNGVVLVGRIKELKTQPVADDVALKHATQLLRAQRTQESLRRQFTQIAAAAKSKVKYNKDYAPPAPPKAGAAAPAAKGAVPAPAATAPATSAPAPKAG